MHTIILLLKIGWQQLSGPKSSCDGKFPILTADNISSNLSLVQWMKWVFWAEFDMLVLTTIGSIEGSQDYIFYELQPPTQSTMPGEDAPHLCNVFSAWSRAAEFCFEILWFHILLEELWIVMNSKSTDVDTKIKQKNWQLTITTWHILHHHINDTLKLFPTTRWYRQELAFVHSNFARPIHVLYSI